MARAYAAAREPLDDIVTVAEALFASSRVARFPELFAGGYVNGLRLLAMAVLLALAACGQSTPRERTRPDFEHALREGAGGAATVDPDAGVVAGLLPDAAVDAGQRPVDWDSLRRWPGRFDVRIAAYNRGVSRAKNNLDFVVFLDRGSLAGIAEGWKGRLLDARGNRVLDEIEVIEVGRDWCRARTTANPDQLAGYRHVVLWNPQELGPP